MLKSRLPRFPLTHNQGFFRPEPSVCIVAAVMPEDEMGKQGERYKHGWAMRIFNSQGLCSHISTAPYLLITTQRNKTFLRVPHRPLYLIMPMKSLRHPSLCHPSLCHPLPVPRLQPSPRNANAITSKLAYPCRKKRKRTTRNIYASLCHPSLCHSQPSPRHANAITSKLAYPCRKKRKRTTRNIYAKNAHA
jgi:hypothetical protein